MRAPHPVTTLDLRCLGLHLSDRLAHSVALGLLGFVEPCAVGGHLIFLRALVERSLAERLVATLTFTLARTLMMGAFGALAALLGQHLIRAQTGFWLVFGSLYLLIGAAYAF